MKRDPCIRSDPGRRERGAALVAALLLGVVALMAALMGAYSARTELRIAMNQYRGLQALYSADAGLNHAFRLLVLNPSGVNAILAGNGVGGDLANLGTATVKIAGLDYRFRSFGGSGTDGYYVRLQDNLDETTNNPTEDADGQVTVISRGQAGEAIRVVEGTIKKESGLCLFGTISGADGIKMSGGSSLVDSFNSAVGPYAFSAGSNAKVATNGNVNASGGVFHGDVSAVGTIAAPTITGTVTTGTAPQSMPLVPACGPPYSAGTGISGTYTYDSVSGELKVNGGNNITLDPGTYCFDTITLSGGSTLTINAGPVIINLTGVLTFSGGSVANNTILASNLRFFSSYAGGSKMVLSGGSGSYMTLYSPAAEIDISGGSSLFGSLVGTVLTFSGGSGIHCDENATSGGAGVQLVEWRQLQ